MSENLFIPFQPNFDITESFLKFDDDENLLSPYHSDTQENEK